MDELHLAVTEAVYKAIERIGEIEVDGIRVLPGQVRNHLFVEQDGQRINFYIFPEVRITNSLPDEIRKALNSKNSAVTTSAYH